MDDWNMWYMVALFSFISLTMIIWTFKKLVANPKLFLIRHFRYPLVLPRGWFNITRLQASTVFLFIASNCAIILAPSFFTDWRKLQQRAAIAAVVNLAPLYLGGRAPVIDALNVPRRWYTLIHFTLGIIATLQGICHAGIALAHHPKSGHLTSFGWAVFGSILGSSSMTLPIVKRTLGKWFQWFHRAASIGAMVTLLWHVLQTSSNRARILVSSSCGLWLLTTAIRIFKMIYHKHTAEVTYVSNTPGAVFVNLRMSHPVSLRPGCYFYIFFPITSPPLRWLKYNFLHSFTATAQYNSPADEGGVSSTMSFLLSRHGNHETAISRLHEGSLLFLDGPYGQEIDLEQDDILVLAAKGMGIAGVLPLATDLAVRRDHDNRIKTRTQDLTERLRREGRNEDLSKEIAYVKAMHMFRDATKKVILFWSLESNSQMDWVEKQLKWLQDMDPQNKLLVVWCGYPDLRTGHDPFNLGSRFWMCLDPSNAPSFENLILRKIQEERARMPGRMTVLACGDPYFTAMIRHGTIRSLKDKPIKFLESEYQSRAVMKMNSKGAADSGKLLQKKRVRGKPQELELQRMAKNRQTTYSPVSEGSFYSVEL